MKAWWSRLTRRRDDVRQVLREADLGLLWRVTVFAVLVPLIMRLKVAQLHRILDRRCPSEGVVDSGERILEHFTLARRIGSPAVRRGCLTRGVTLCYFLRRAGHDVSLRFGMARLPGGFEGHCWLVKGDLPFMEEPDPRPVYAPILTVPRTSSAADANPRALSRLTFT